MKFPTWAAIIAIIVLPLEGAFLATDWHNHSCPIGEAVRMPMPFDHSHGRAWYTEIPDLERLADDGLDAYRSPLVICENNRVLGPAHSHHHDIAKSGSGRFSHWATGLVFSTSDNSDPNTNGRSYLAIRIKPETSPSMQANVPPAQPASELPPQPASKSQAELAALASSRQVVGRIVKLDKANEQISVQRDEPGQSSGVIEQFLLTHEPAHDVLKAGDQVALTIALQNGVWKVTRYSRLP